MKSIACYALHYGAEYLAWSIRSVQDAVDEIHILYTDKPSYGHSSGVPCPESERELISEAHRFLNKPIFWHKGCWSNEGEHKGAFMDVAKNAKAEMILVVDSDELWVPGAAKQALEHAYNQNNSGRWLINFQNFWRSFKYEVRDCFQPVRVIDTRNSLSIDSYFCPSVFSPVYHFGYAQANKILKYKWTCHGHQSELRKDWYVNKFMAWTPQTADSILDLHPTVNNLWVKAFRTNEVVDSNMVTILGDHPYSNKDIIV